MPVEFERYKIDHAGISRWMMGPEMEDALRAAADDVIGLARGPLAVGQANWSNERGPDWVSHGYPRQTRRAVNDHPAAAAREFGSGLYRDRPQGGGNEPTRALGRAGARIGDYKGSQDLSDFA